MKCRIMQDLELVYGYALRHILSATHLSLSLVTSVIDLALDLQAASIASSPNAPDPSITTSCTR